MSWPSGPIWLPLVATSAIASGCLGDVPAFSGSGGASSASASETSGSMATGTPAGSTSGGEGGTVAASSSGSGSGGAPAGSSSASSSSSGSGGCGLDELPDTCDEAYVALECASLGTPETCSADGCPVAECGFPVAILLQNPPGGYCSTASDSADPPCLMCDGAGPAIALATTDPPGPLAIAAFAPGMPTTLHLVARGEGTFQLAWWDDNGIGADSQIFTLTSEQATYALALATSALFEVRILPSSSTGENVPLWMEIDCVYTTGTASATVLP